MIASCFSMLWCPRKCTSHWRSGGLHFAWPSHRTLSTWVSWLDWEAIQQTRQATVWGNNSYTILIIQNEKIKLICFTCKLTLPCSHSSALWQTAFTRMAEVMCVCVCEHYETISAQDAHTHTHSCNTPHTQHNMYTHTFIALMQKIMRGKLSYARDIWQILAHMICHSLTKLGVAAIICSRQFVTTLYKINGEGH